MEQVCIFETILPADNKPRCNYCSLITINSKRWWANWPVCNKDNCIAKDPLVLFTIQKLTGRD